MIYIFRNNTLEYFFGKDYSYSGYGDVYHIPEADEYLWWYQVPINFRKEQLVEELQTYPQRLLSVLEQIGSKTIYVFTLSKIVAVATVRSDVRVNKAINDFNNFIYALAERSNVKIIDIDDFLAKYSSADVFDWRYYMQSQMPYSLKLVRPFQVWWSRRMEEIKLQRKKCLVLDLDNTLWKGVVGEDGLSGIQMSGDYPGKAFHFWQVGIKQLKEDGVILALCSKNNLSDIEEVWQERQDMVLRPEDFAAMRINWQDKATNIREIAEELNIGLDSMVFVDDNPTERELIRQQLSMVVVPDFPNQPFELPELLQQLSDVYFGIYHLTEEDKKKTEQYAQNALRQREVAQYGNYTDYLKSLDMHLTIDKVTDTTLSRVAQLTQKTNQFNLTTRRYTETDIHAMLASGADIWTLTVIDRFGDYGLTGVLIITANNDIDTLLMSCRVLGKGIEEAFLKFVLAKSEDATITASYLPTKKNKQVESFYDKLGFTCLTEDNETKHYQAIIKDLNLQIAEYYTIIKKYGR